MSVHTKGIHPWTIQPKSYELVFTLYSSLNNTTQEICLCVHTLFITEQYKPIGEKGVHTVFITEQCNPELEFFKEVVDF